MNELALTIWHYALVSSIAMFLLWVLDRFKARREARKQAWAQHQHDMRKFDADMAVAMMGDDPNPLTSAMDLSCIITPGGATTTQPCEPVYNVGDTVIVPALSGGYETKEITDLADPFDTGTPYVMAGKRILNREEIIAKVTQ